VRGWRSAAVTFASKRSSQQAATVSKRRRGETGSRPRCAAFDQCDTLAAREVEVKADCAKPQPAGVPAADRVLPVGLPVDAALHADTTAGAALRSMSSSSIAWDLRTLVDRNGIWRGRWAG
jgi:hypothetical protein